MPENPWLASARESIANMRQMLDLRQRIKVKRLAGQLSEAWLNSKQRVLERLAERNRQLWEWRQSNDYFETSPEDVDLRIKIFHEFDQVQAAIRNFETESTL